MPDHPVAPEQRTIDVDVQDVDTRGRTLVGYAAVYGAVSDDLGGFTECIAPGAFGDVLRSQPDVRALLNHDANQVLGRTRSGTLRLADEERGLRFELDLPDSPLGETVRAAVERRDIDGASFRFRCGRDSWDGTRRTVEEISELMDVTVATFGAYPAASVELRTRPTPEPEEEAPVPDNPAGGLRLEERAAATPEVPTVEARVIDAIRNVQRGESRDLTNATATPISQPEVSTFLWDLLRPASALLASGVRVISTASQSIVWPRIVTSVDPTWIAETEVIPEGDPAFGQLTATPKKLAHRVELSNELIDDSEPSIIDILNRHLGQMLALKLDVSALENNPASNPDGIRGLKYVPGIQTLSMGTNGAALTNYDPLLQAVGMLRASNVAGPYAAVVNPRSLLALELLKAETGSNEQLGAPAGLPMIYTTSQASMTETKGTATNASSIYVYAPAEIVVVRRQDTVIEVDRSRLFDRDMSEIRAKLRADLLVPNPMAVVRIDGVIPAA
jgi:HK97 family phage prohead protease